MNSSVWEKGKRYNILGYTIVVAKARTTDPRKFYTELHTKDDAYLTSAGSDMPTHLLAAIETYLRRGKIL